MLSIIVPAYKEPYLNKTIQSLLDGAVYDIEIIPVLDGYTPDEPIPKHDKVYPIVLTKNKGMRNAINVGLGVANGRFIMKVDAHCAFDKGYDKKLTDKMERDWLMIPRRYSLNPDTWTANKNKGVNDYHYLNFPEKIKYGYYMGPTVWKKENDLMIDDTMTFQGSCWVAYKQYFMNHVGYLDDRPETYGTFAAEQEEVGLKYWLGGGEVKVNKHTWYAHLSKRQHHYDKKMFSREYKLASNIPANNTWSTNHWIHNEEPSMIFPFSWLIDKFWPIPTWPDNWRDILYEKHNGLYTS